MKAACVNGVKSLPLSLAHYSHVIQKEQLAISKQKIADCRTEIGQRQNERTCGIKPQHSAS